ncbi:hypothetical protein Nmel_016686 [Mimus melanotis]
MEQRRSLAVPCGAPVLAISFLACVATAVRLKPESLILPPRLRPGEVSRAAFVGKVWLRMLKCPCPPSSAGLELSVNNHAADFTLSTKLVPAISLSCLVQNSSQAEELLWYRGDGQVSLKDGNKVNISNICISPVNESDNGVTFTCRLARDKSVQVSVILDVQSQSTWLKDNHNLTLQQSRHEVYQTSEIFRLSIKKVQKSDNGTYTCVVESPLGYGTRDFHLIVEDKKPVFPTEAVIAGAVVVGLTILFGIVARKDKIFKCFKKPREIVLS